MTLTLGTPSLRACAAAALLAAAAPAHAEGNRLLPFWSQPYPYGYSRREAEPPRREERSCTAGARRPGSLGAARRCAVVLHARD